MPDRHRAELNVPRLQLAGRDLDRLAIDVTTRLLATLEDSAREIAAEVADWPTTSDASLTPATRRRLDAVVRRASVEDRPG